MFSKCENMRVGCGQPPPSSIVQAGQVNPQSGVKPCGLHALQYGLTDGGVATGWRNFGRLRRKRTPYIYFCETNPIFIEGKTSVMVWQANAYRENGRRNELGSFSKTNPISGGPDVLFGRLFRLSERFFDQVDAAGGGADIGLDDALGGGDDGFAAVGIFQQFLHSARRP